jgi:hypothetical protein
LLSLSFFQLPFYRQVWLALSGWKHDDDLAYKGISSARMTIPLDTHKLKDLIQKHRKVIIGQQQPPPKKPPQRVSLGDLLLQKKPVCV